MTSEISVIGAGYVGLTTAVLFAQAGYKVHLIEIDDQRLAVIKEGRSFFYEAGLDPLIRDSLSSGLLVPTDSYLESIPTSQFIFSCVGTPDNPDGSPNLTYIFAAAEESLKHMKSGTTYVQKSTVPVGTGMKIEDMFKDVGLGLDYVSNPEFLREGTAIIDSLWPDRVVVGSQNSRASEKVIDLYKGIEKLRSDIAKKAQLEPGLDAKTEYFAANLNSAELIKVTANAFLALKISFANSIAKLADQTGANISEVMSGVGSDKRIGRAFLNAGRGYGGGCFPKDVSGLISSAAEHGVDLQIMTAASDVNASMPGYIANKAKQNLGVLKNKDVAVLGLAFKAGTSDVRKSPGVKLANILATAGARVRVYDPKTTDEVKDDLRKNIVTADSLDSATKGCEAVFITTDWPQFTNYDLAKLAKAMKGSLFFDCMNVFSAEKVRAAGLEYLGVGQTS